MNLRLIHRGTFTRHLYVGLLIVLVCSCVVVEACWHEKEVTKPELGPLESPFNEIIPSAEALLLEPFSHNEETIYHPDGLITYSRVYENESASYTPLSGAEKSKSPAMVLSLVIRAYQNEEKAQKYIREESKRKWYDKSLSESYARLLELPSEDVVGHMIFWKEPGDDDVQGEEEILFRVGRYVGNYAVHIDNPPELEDGFFMPPDLHDLLEFALMKTDITKLRLL
jgi:hypothetical protein